MNLRLLITTDFGSSSADVLSVTASFIITGAVGSNIPFSSIEIYPCKSPVFALRSTCVIPSSLRRFLIFCPNVIKKSFLLSHPTLNITNYNRFPAYSSLLKPNQVISTFCRFACQIISMFWHASSTIYCSVTQIL